MSRRENEVLANFVARKKGARRTTREDTDQSDEPSPDTPATQADITGVCQVVAQLLQQQQQMQAAPRSTPSSESYYERFKRLNPPPFEGGADPLAAETWIREVEKMYDALQYPEDVKVRLAIPLLRGNAEFWWAATKVAYENTEDQLTWEEFKRIFYDQYFPNSVRLAKENEFLALKQEDMTVLEYANKFNELGRFCPQLMEASKSKANRFEHGLRYGIRSRLSSHIFTDYKDVLERALKVESDLKRSEQERGDKKRPRPTETSKDQPRNLPNNTDNNKEATTCGYCGKNHYEPCRKKLGACFSCGEVGHIVRECPVKKKDNSKSARPTDQNQKGNAQVFSLTQQDASANEQVETGTILVNFI